MGEIIFKIEFWLPFIYYYLGKAMVIFSGILVSVIFIGYVIIQTLNLIGNNYKPMWYVLDYLRHKKEFKEFVKEKNIKLTKIYETSTCKEKEEES